MQLAKKLVSTYVILTQILIFAKCEHYINNEYLFMKYNVKSKIVLREMFNQLCSQECDK